MNNFNKILVTGGSGFLGKNIKEIYPNWAFVSSKDCNFMDSAQTRELFENHKPDCILHLAGRVGGIKDNEENQADFFYINNLINTNVLHQAHLTGVQRVLSSLSTCAFPDKLETYPFTETNLFDGPPAETNMSYGMTKRALHVASTSYRKQYGRNYSTFCPSNLYGPHDDFESEYSHFIPSMIRKILDSNDGDCLEFWGTGEPLRQQMYVGDLVKIIPELIEKHNSATPLIVSPDNNTKIKEIIRSFLSIVKKDVIISFNNKLDGQYRKDGSNKELLKLINNFEFTSLECGLRKTLEWYSKQ
jgi:GDP-L-fucose synthase